MSPPRPVLLSFGGPLSGLQWHSVAGGLSGAEVWRGDDSSGAARIALKCWPADYPPERLLQVHGWIHRASRSLPFISPLLCTSAGTIVANEGRIWDATRWMPGRATRAASLPEIESACAAVALLHAVWRDECRGPSPGVRKRIRILSDWLAGPSSPDDLISFMPHLNKLLRHVTDTLSASAPACIRKLELWENVPVALQPCVRDLRAEHILFDESTVTGIVDFGAMAIDNPAVDLARLLSDLASGGSAFTAGLRAYRQAGGVLDFPDEIVQLLGRSGLLGSMVTWMTRLCRGADRLPAPAVAEARLEHLLHRFRQSWTH